ncbi:MAG: hypothetical protein ACTSQ4_04900 [Candidatus Heimdallarchaeaceae archaeon]
MGKRNRKKGISNKVPKQKFPFDSKIPKHKLPKDKIPKRQIRDEEFFPPEKRKSRKVESKPSRSHLKNSRESGKNKGIPKEKIVSKTPGYQKFKQTRKDSKNIPKQKIPKSKIPKQDKFSSTESLNYVPQEEKDKQKKRDSSPPRREKFKEIDTINSKALKKEEKKKREEIPPSDDRDKFSEIKESDSRSLPKEEKREKKLKEAPATTSIQEAKKDKIPEQKIPKHKVPSQKYPKQTKKPRQKRS